MSDMQFHLGRLLDHVHLRVSDLEAARGFYAAVLGALGRGITFEGPGFFVSDELFVSADGPPVQGLHLAFQAADQAAVARFHAAGLAAGGRDNGRPGERHYHPGYYAAYLLDPDGTNVEAVVRGAALRSADSVTVVPVLGGTGAEAGPAADPEP